MNQLKTIPLIAMLMLAGCLATADTDTSKRVVEYEPMVYHNNSSYQFDNLAPMSYGESFNLTLNETTTLYVELYTVSTTLWFGTKECLIFPWFTTTTHGLLRPMIPRFKSLTTLSTKVVILRFI